MDDSVLDIRGGAITSYPVEEIEKIQDSCKQAYCFFPFGFTIGLLVGAIWSYHFGFNGFLASLVLTMLLSLRKREQETKIIRLPHNLWLEVISK